MSTKVTANGCYWLSWLGEIRFTSSVSGGAESDRTWTAFEKTIPCAHIAVFSVILYYWIWSCLFFFIWKKPTVCSFENEVRRNSLGVHDVLSKSSGWCKAFISYFYTGVGQYCRNEDPFPPWLIYLYWPNKPHHNATLLCKFRLQANVSRFKGGRWVTPQ